MQAGPLRHRLLLVQRDPVDDNRGGRTSENGSELASVSGSVEPLSASEEDAVGRIASGVTHRIAVRWSSVSRLMRPEDSIWKGDREFVIVGVRNEDERNVMLLFDCRESVPRQRNANE